MVFGIEGLGIVGVGSTVGFRSRKSMLLNRFNCGCSRRVIYRNCGLQGRQER